MGPDGHARADLARRLDELRAAEFLVALGRQPRDDEFALLVVDEEAVLVRDDERVPPTAVARRLPQALVAGIARTRKRSSRITGSPFQQR